VAGVVEERPTDGPGRPRATPPRLVKALRDRLQGTLPARAEVIARKRHETGGCVRLTTVPPAGELAPRAEDVRRAYKEPQGIEPTVAFVKAPRIVNRLFLQKPERIEAVGLG
jgi:hypothetical protein